jgi:hypothetical protein
MEREERQRQQRAARSATAGEHQLTMGERVRVEDDKEWTAPAMTSASKPQQPKKGKKSGKNKKGGKKGSASGAKQPNGFAAKSMAKGDKNAASELPGGNSEDEDEDDDMAFLEREIRTQRKEAQRAAKADPAHGWKRWVTKDGVLVSPSKPAEEARAAALKRSLKSKVAAQEEQRQSKKSQQGSGSGGRK